MSTLKSVGHKLFKAELESHKVELGISDEILKTLADANAMLRVLKNDKTLLINAEKSILEVKAEAQKIKSDSEKNSQKALGSTLPDINVVLDKADAAAKDLGLDSKGIKGYVELKKLYDSVNEARKEVGNGYIFKN